MGAPGWHGMSLEPFRGPVGARATLGFSRVTCAHTCQNPYLHPQAQVFAGTGRGFTKTHGYPNLHGVMPPELTNEPHKGSASVN